MSVTFSNAFQSALRSSGDCEVEFYIESMDLTRFPAQRHHEELLELYPLKYSDTKLDLIVAAQFPSLHFLAEYLDKSLPWDPVLVVNIDSRLIRDRELLPDATVLAGKLDFSGTMALSMSIHPDVRKVFVVSRASGYDEALLTLAREELHTFEDRLELSCFSGLPMDELIHRVSNLAEHSLVPCVSYFRDGRGKAFKSPDALALISRQANATADGVSETLIVLGTAGGNLNSPVQPRWLLASSREKSRGTRLFPGKARVSFSSTRTEGRVPACSTHCRAWGCSLPPADFWERLL